MDIKTKFLKSNRIAMLISVIGGPIMAIMLFKRLELDCIFGGIIFLAGLLILVLDERKYRLINRTLGFLKINSTGDMWLGYDGNWHDGYKQICNKRIQDYYDNGGEDVGHTFGRITRGFTFMWMMLGVIGMAGEIKQMGIFSAYYFWGIVWMLYIIKTKVISG